MRDAFFVEASPLPQGFLDLLNILLASDCQTLAPKGLPLERTPRNRIVNSRGVKSGKILGVIEVEPEQQVLGIDQTVSPSCANKLVVSTPAPIPRVLNNASSDHIHIYVSKTVQQMLAVFDHRALIWMLPHRAFAFLAPIQMPRDCRRRQMHHFGNGISVMRVGHDMDMIASNAVGIHGDPVPVYRCAQPLAILLTFLSEFEEKPPVMTAMCQVVRVPLQKIS